MSLPPGLYHIFSGPVFVGRHLVEDRSLNPKRVLALPPGVRPRSPWGVEPLGDGRYKLKASGAPVAEIDGLLWAILIDQDDRELEWVITPQPHGLFTIRKSKGDEVWVNVEGSDGEMSQIAVKADYSRNHLFRFEAIQDE